MSLSNRRDKDKRKEIATIIERWKEARRLCVVINETEGAILKPRRKFDTEFKKSRIFTYGKFLQINPYHLITNRPEKMDRIISPTFSYRGFE